MNKAVPIFVGIVLLIGLAGIIAKMTTKPDYEPAYRPIRISDLNVAYRTKAHEVVDTVYYPQHGDDTVKIPITFLESCRLSDGMDVEFQQEMKRRVDSAREEDGEK